MDFLSGERLVVEVDSRWFHPFSGPDRDQDARLSALGFRVLRFSYEQVLHDWPTVELAVLSATTSRPNG